MSIFKPVLVNKKENLDSVAKVLGQYIIVADTKELYVDKADDSGNVVRANVSRNNVFLQTTPPTNPIEGDIWLETEE